MIKQAIILAGGLGERLRPLTNGTPKPLISINGRPFISYLIDRLLSQGVEEVLILTGYMGEQFCSLLNFYKKEVIKIITTPVHFQTGNRVLNISHLLRDEFFILYGDNYWPFDLSLMYKNFLVNNCFGQIVIYQNKDRYSLSNINIDDDNLIIEYNKMRNNSNLEYVDIGFGIFKKEVIDLLDFEINESFEKQVYNILIDKNQLYGFRTLHKYYTLTNIDRLGPLELVLSDKKYLFLDRDGVLNQKASRGEYIIKWSDWVWVDGAISLLKYCKSNDIRVIIITNQACIGRGIATQPQIDYLHTQMIGHLNDNGANCIESIYVCPHDWNDDCSCRKPAPGLLIRAQKNHNIDLSRCYFVGDSESDVQAAESAGAIGLKINSSQNIFEQLSVIL